MALIYWKGISLNRFSLCLTCFFCVIPASVDPDSNYFGSFGMLFFFFFLISLTISEFNEHLVKSLFHFQMFPFD